MRWIKKMIVFFVLLYILFPTTNDQLLQAEGANEIKYKNSKTGQVQDGTTKFPDLTNAIFHVAIY